MSVGTFLCAREPGPGQIVLAYSCGYWEMDNFDLLHAQMHAFCEYAERECAGALLRPHGPALQPMVKKGTSVDDIFEAAKEAGRQVVVDGKMSPETLTIVSRELLPLEMWARGNSGICIGD